MSDHHCTDFRGLLDRLLDGEITPEEKARMDAHAARCPECAALREAMLADRAALAEALNDVPPMPAGTHEAWTEAVRAEKNRVRAGARNKWLRWAGAAAAVLYLVGGTYLTKDRLKRITEPPAAPRPAMQAQQRTPAPVPQQTGEPAAAPVGIRTPEPTARPGREADVTAAGLPLPGAADAGITNGITLTDPDAEGGAMAANALFMDVAAEEAVPEEAPPALLAEAAWEEPAAEEEAAAAWDGFAPDAAYEAADAAFEEYALEEAAEETDFEDAVKADAVCGPWDGPVPDTGLYAASTADQEPVTAAAAMPTAAPDAEEDDATPAEAAEEPQRKAAGTPGPALPDAESAEEIASAAAFTEEAVPAAEPLPAADHTGITEPAAESAEASGESAEASAEAAGEAEKKEGSFLRYLPLFAAINLPLFGGIALAVWLTRRRRRKQAGEGNEPR